MQMGWLCANSKSFEEEYTVNLTMVCRNRGKKVTQFRDLLRSTKNSGESPGILGETLEQQAGTRMGIITRVSITWP